MDPPSTKIFLSHTHDDRGLAHALRDLFKDTFGDRIELRYSSDSSRRGGVAPGANWLEWISEAVKECDLTFVLLTPRSVGKPWVLWESGAVAGAALATKKSASVVPVLYRMRFEDIPQPLQQLQAAQGETEEGLERLLQLIDETTTKFTPVMFKTVLDSQVPTYFKTVESALIDQPLPLDEAQVSEWINRLDRLKTAGRISEVGHVHRALQIATGGRAGERLLDLRIHRRLAELYLESRQLRPAIEQFEFALRLAPRDIYLLHQLGLAYLEARELERASETLRRVAILDPEANNAFPEMAGFNGRLHRERWKQSGNLEDLRKARDAYAVVLDAQPNSYFLADNVGQISLTLGEKDRAKTAFQLAKSIIERSGERSVWSLATLATSALVLGEDIEVHLKAIHALGPAPREVESIVGGLQRVQQSLGLSADLHVGWRRMLTAGAD